MAQALFIFDHGDTDIAFAFFAIAHTCGDRDARLRQQLLGKFQTAQMRERRGQWGPCKHGRARRWNVPAGLGKAIDQYIAALAIEFPIGGHNILRAIKRGDGGRLNGGEGPIIQIGFHTGEGGDQRFIAHRKADAPSGHGIGFGHGGKLHRYILCAFDLQDGGGGLPIIIKF